MNPSASRVLILLACQAGMIGLIVASLHIDIMKRLGFAATRMRSPTPELADRPVKPQWCSGTVRPPGR